jgi:large subunit ribosomal protein L17
MRPGALFVPKPNTRVRHLGVSEAHRKDILKCLVTSLVQNERIVTTLAKAKEMRRYVEQTITAAKVCCYVDGNSNFFIILFQRGDIPEEEWTQYLSSPRAIEKVKTLLAERYRDRPGGYVRVLKNGFR